MRSISCSRKKSVTNGYKLWAAKMDRQQVCFTRDERWCQKVLHGRFGNAALFSMGFDFDMKS